jgi:hypothetical protein
MAQIEINSFFTRGGAPATDIDNLNPHPDGKNYPRTRIWEISGSSYDLVVGDTIGSGQNTDGLMAPIVDTAVEDGFYSFIFTDTIGFSESKKYLVRSDGGPSLPTNERYQVAEITPAGTATLTPGDINAIIDGVWDETSAAHNTAGTFGNLVNQIDEVRTAAECACTNTTTLLPQVQDILDIVNILLNFDANRTKIDKVAKTLTVYADDNVTPIRVFRLLDSTGTPSVDEVCERVPLP